MSLLNRMVSRPMKIPKHGKSNGKFKKRLLNVELVRYQQEDELQATEVDLKEFEAQEHVCHICKQPFPIRAILLQHLVTCRATAENAGKYLKRKLEISKVQLFI